MPQGDNMIITNFIIKKKVKEIIPKQEEIIDKKTFDKLISECKCSNEENNGRNTETNR